MQIKKYVSTSVSKILLFRISKEESLKSANIWNFEIQGAGMGNSYRPCRNHFIPFSNVTQALE